MKRLNYFLFFVLLGVLIPSCQKDGDDAYGHDSPQVYQRSYNQEDCGFTDSFCEQQFIYAISSPQEIQPLIVNDDETAFALPVNLFDGSVAIEYSDGDQTIYVIETDDERLLSISNQELVPSKIQGLLEIDYRNIEDGNKVIEDITNSEGYNLHNVGSSGTYKLSSNTESEEVEALVIFACDYYRASNVQLFLNVFFQQFDASQIEGFVEDAYAYAESNSECLLRGSDENGCRYNCIDPRCIVDYMLEIDAGFGDSQKQTLLVRYLSETLGLTDEEQHFLGLSENYNFLTEIYNQLGTELNLGECDNEDCSMRYSVETLIGLEMSGQTSTMSNSEQFEFYANLYCCDEPSLLDEVEDVKLNGYPNPTTDAILEGMSNMCCGENAMSQSEFASLMADQLNAELASIGESWPTSPDFFDNDFFEIMFEMMKEIVPELIPGVDTYIELKNAMEAYDNGNYWQSAESFAFAVLTVTPADKCKDFVKVFKTGRKGFKIFRLFDKLKALDPLLAKGFKETLLKLQKNDKIFRKHPGHWPDLKNVTKAVGGKENLVFNVYKKVFDSGIINSLTVNTPFTFNITINGVHIRGTVIKLPNGTIRIDDFWIP